MMSAMDLKLFWEWKRKDLIVQLVKGHFTTWSDFEALWHVVEHKNDEYPDKKSPLFSDYIYWKTKGKPVITEILPEAAHLRKYYENLIARRLKSTSYGQKTDRDRNMHK